MNQMQLEDQIIATLIEIFGDEVDNVTEDVLKVLEFMKGQGWDASRLTHVYQYIAITTYETMPHLEELRANNN